MKILKDKNAETTISTAVAIMISVVLGGLILFGVMTMVDANVAPQLGKYFNQNTSQTIAVTQISSTFTSKEYDFNNDGVVNEDDAIYFERYLCGWEGYSMTDESDINKDGYIDRTDYQLFCLAINDAINGVK